MTKKKKKRLIKRNGVFYPDDYGWMLDTSSIVGYEIEHIFYGITKKSCLEICIEAYDCFSTCEHDIFKQKFQEIGWDS